LEHHLTGHRFAMMLSSFFVAKVGFGWYVFGVEFSIVLVSLVLVSLVLAMFDDLVKSRKNIVLSSVGEESFFLTIGYC